MRQKTELPGSAPRQELPNAYLLSLVAATAIVLLLVFVGPLVLSHPFKLFHIEGRGPLPWLFPWVLGSAQTIANGLTEFSGRSLQPVDPTIYLESLLSILLFGVIAPTLALLLMGKNISAIPKALRLVSAIVVVTLAVIVIPTGYVSYRTRVAVRSAQAVQVNKDRMINELNTIAWKLREYRIVPKALGGGGGSVTGYVLPAGLAQTDNATYVVRVMHPPSTETPGAVMATLHATSRKFAGAEVDVAILENGGMREWTYTGAFQ